MRIETVSPAVLLRLNIEPEPASCACCRCGRRFSGKVLVHDLRRLACGIVIDRGCLCPACFAVHLLLDEDLPGGDDCPSWGDFRAVRELLEG